MRIVSPSLGNLEVDESRIITFPSGLYGFAKQKRFVILDDDHVSMSFLQSVDDHALKFSIWHRGSILHECPNPECHGCRELRDELGAGIGNILEIFLVCNTHDGKVTANAKAPLIVNAITQRGIQYINSAGDHMSRVPLDSYMVAKAMEETQRSGNAQKSM